MPYQNFRSRIAWSGMFLSMILSICICATELSDDEELYSTRALFNETSDDDIYGDLSDEEYRNDLLSDDFINDNDDDLISDSSIEDLFNDTSNDDEGYYHSETDTVNEARDHLSHDSADDILDDWDQTSKVQVKKVVQDSPSSISNGKSQTVHQSSAIEETSDIKASTAISQINETTPEYYFYVPTTESTSTAISTDDYYETSAHNASTSAEEVNESDDHDDECGIAENECGDNSTECEKTCTEPCCEECPTFCNACEECNRMFAKLDFLYFYAIESDLGDCGSFDNKTFENECGTSISITKEKTKDPNFKWNPGFRIGLGWELEPSCWDMGVYWTHYNSCAKNDSHSNKLQWMLDLNLVDVLAGNDIFFTPCCSIRPYGGLRVASINQNVSFYFVSTVDAFGQKLLYHSKRKNDQKYLAGGIHLGLEGNYAIGCGFSVYGNAAFSTLCGKSETRCREREDFIFNFDSTDSDKMSYDCLPITQFSLGIRWLRCSCCMWFLQQISWENQRFYDYDKIGCGDLNVDGLSYSIVIEF